MTNFNHAMSLIADRDYASAIDVLEDLLLDDPHNPDVLYNLGLCFNEIGQPKKAVKPLTLCLSHSPDRTNAYVALGFAQTLLGDVEKAKNYFLEALHRDAGNTHALRNMGALLGKEGDLAKSLYYLSRAYETDPSDPRTVYGLGYTYEDLGDPQNAQRYYREASSLISEPEVQDQAQKRLTEMASKTFRADGPRMDCVYYMIKALSIFDSESEEEMRRIVMEIALLGRNGFQLNDSSVRYTLNSLPGEFSGLQLLSYMYAGFQLIDPSVDVGIDLTEEYLIATNLYSSEDIV